MKSLKVLSVIGLIWFGLCFVCILAFINNDVSAAAGWGLYAVLYGIALSIVALVQVKRIKTKCLNK